MVHKKKYKGEKPNLTNSWDKIIVKKNMCDVTGVGQK
jgi:hypothetical protein